MADINRKIKIALVITRMDRGGAPDIVKSLFDYLNMREYESILISGPTIIPTKDIKNFMDKNRNNIVIIPDLKRNPNLINDTLAFIKLFLLFRKERFDIVHTHTAKAGFIGRIAAKLAGIRLIIHTPHGHNLYGYFNFWFTQSIIILERIASLFTDKIIALTNIEKTDMIRYNICKPSKIAVIRSGINLDIYDKIKVDIEQKKAEFDAARDDFLVGMIGRLDVVKGPEYFIEASKYIAEKLPQTRFLIVGDGSLREKLISRSRQLDLEEKIAFLGWREDTAEILSILDVLVLTSLNEAVGRVLLEAGASAKPVVATNVGGIPEILKDNETGILVSAGDSRKIANAVINLLKDEKKRFEMGQAAKDWINVNFNEKRMVVEIHNLYKSLLNI